MSTLPGLPQPFIAKVDCGSCRKCCKGNSLIMLQDDESPDRYDCVWHPHFDGYALKRKPNGDCVYLGEDGCTIWGRHPIICRIFDCADFAMRMDEGAYDAIGPHLDNDVTEEGRRRLKAREGG